MENLKADLKNEIQEADWNMLKVHHDNGAVYIVEANLTLVDVGFALAKDKVDFVKIWLDNKELVRPTDEQVEEFKKDQFKYFCNFLIVQPYVLIKLN